MTNHFVFTPFDSSSSPFSLHLHLPCAHVAYLLEGIPTNLLRLFSLSFILFSILFLRLHDFNCFLLAFSDSCSDVLLSPSS